MTLNQIVNAYAHIGELSKLVFPYQTTSRLIRLKKRIKEEFDTVVTMEKALVEKYDGAAGKNGAYSFPDDEKREQFAEEYDKLMNGDQDIKLPAVDLSKYTDMIRISPAAMEALEGIVTFERPEKTEEAD